MEMALDIIIICIAIVAEVISIYIWVGAEKEDT